MERFWGTGQENAGEMTFAEFMQLVATRPDGVVLLEGRRAIPERDVALAEGLGRMLALAFPRLRFRSGNACGSDEAFSTGVASVDSSRLQVVLPYAGHRRGSRISGAAYASLDSQPVLRERELAARTFAASPKYRTLIEHRDRGRQMAARAAYLIRDTMKAVGWSAEFPEPICACFYVDVDDPFAGGTGHTIRACQREGVPVVFQDAWRQWSVERSATHHPSRER